MATAENLIVPRFFIHTTPDPLATKTAGRPMFKDMECCEIRFASNKQTVAVFPAHEISHWQESADGTNEPLTYAMRFKPQYEKFKAGEAQAMSGTPLEELTFLTQAKRYELKALSIYTAEALAALDGQALKNLGIGGRDLKNQAQVYLDKASKNADVLALASENETLRQKLASLQSAPATVGEVTDPRSPFADFDEEALKEWIADATGARPRGNPSKATLLRMADEANRELKAKDKDAA